MIFLSLASDPVLLEHLVELGLDDLELVIGHFILGLNVLSGLIDKAEPLVLTFA